MMTVKSTFQPCGLVLLCLLWLPLPLASQATEDGSFQELPRGYSSLSFGMTLEEAKEELLGDSMFRYRGDPDVSLRPSDGQPIIRVAGGGFITSGVFQFHENQLYSITVNLDPERIDYFSMYRNLSEKYGEPDVLNPQLCYWEGSGVRMVLEKPLSVKYLDMEVFDAIRQAGAAQESLGEMSRQLFLESF